VPSSDYHRVTVVTGVTNFDIEGMIRSGYGRVTAITNSGTGE
jgi:hypothetical protein